MFNYLPNSKMHLLLLATTLFAFSACEDDDVLGIDLSNDGTLFISSNTSGTVGVIDTRDSESDRETMTFTAAGTDADGIFFKEDEGIVYQVNRSNGSLVQYEDVLDDINDDEGVDVNRVSAAGDFSNGRGLARMGDNRFVVAQDDDDDTDADDNDRFVVFEDDGSNITRTLTYTAPFNVWGIQGDGTILYAVIDNTDSIAIFDDFLSAADSSVVVPTRSIQVEGIVRTHGLEYYRDSDLMLLTDIGDAAVDNDGAIIVIRNFSTLTDSTITAANYTRIGGASTTLGNPVDVAYDERNEDIYVAERAANGGMILTFGLDDVGDVAPKISVPYPGASSLYLNND